MKIDDKNTGKLLKLFTSAMRVTLCRAELKHRCTNWWLDPEWEKECLANFKEHLDKGDPVEVACYCAFLWYHGWKTNGELKEISDTFVEDLRMS